MKTNKVKTQPEAVEVPNLKIAKSESEHSGDDNLKVTESVKTTEPVKKKRSRGRPAGSKNKAARAKAKATTKRNAKKTSQTKSTQTQQQKSGAKTEPFAKNNEMLQAAMMSGTKTAETAKKMSEEMMKFANRNMSENVELSREFFGCRTLSDMFEIQNKMIKKNFDSFFKQSSKMSEMMFKAAGKTGAPLNTTFTDMADEMNKKING